MAKDPLTELLDFLRPETRLDLKDVALDHLLGLSATKEGIQTLMQNEFIVKKILELSDDSIDEIAKNALLLLVNITADPDGTKKLLQYRPDHYKNVIELFIGYVMNPQKKDADAACMILSNITRLEDDLEEYLDLFFPHLNDILNVYLNIDFNKKGSKLHYLGPMFSNLSRSKRICKWLTDENPHVPLIKLLPFCNYDQSLIRKGGAIGTVRNIAFLPEYHDFLLQNDLDLLTYLLNPLMGNEDYPDDEMDTLPVALQYLPKEKQREADVDIRKMIVETLNRFCLTRKHRELLRSNGVYYVLREYHKWEKDPKALLACENVVDILIRKEEEIGVDDLSSVVVTDDLTEKFEQMDQEFLKSVVE